MHHNPTVGVGAIIVKDDKVLLVKRAKMPFAGLWCIPGGKVKFGETLQNAAEREIYEETRLVIKAGEPLYVFETMDSNTQDIKYHYVVVDLQAEYISGVATAHDDALEVAWFSRSDLERNDIQEQTRNCLQRCWHLT